MNGMANVHEYPQLNPLPPRLLHWCSNYTKHMSSKSTFYNNILSIAQTTVDNGRTTTYEQIGGPHSVKLNGRVIHYIPSNKPSDRRGLAYFTYDCSDKNLDDHVDLINASITEIENRVEHKVLKDFFNEMKINNIYVKQVTTFSLSIINYNYKTLLFKCYDR